MTESNLDIVRSIWRDFPRGGVDAVLHRFAPDFVWIIDMEDREVRGHEGLRAYFGELEERGASVRVVPYDFEAEGDYVLVPGTIRVATPESTGDFQVFLLYELSGGVVVRARSFSDRGSAVAAMRDVSAEAPDPEPR